ncbi:MAG: FAD-dependent thymidylate synthase, partial [bacterium]|nr:FAD-dependent thymidylate synthase [bacterium]
VNEYSARYSILNNEFYIPTPEHMAVQSSTNRQGRGAVLPAELTDLVASILRRESEGAYKTYEALLSDDGTDAPPNIEHPQLARELARMALSLNFYTEWYWKCNLHNLFHFLSLRADPHAQYEIRAYAEVMLDIVRKWVPLSCAAFEEYRLNAFTLSRSMRKALARMLAGEVVTQATSGMSAREWEEFQAGLESPV